MEESQREMFLHIHYFKASRGIYFTVLAQSSHDSMHHELQHANNGSVGSLRAIHG